MRLHILEHVPFESPAYILDWAQAKGLSPTQTRLYGTILFPDQDAFESNRLMSALLDCWIA
ncbi:MAG TPA: hypothetical protein ENN17_12005 [bacterium]|nr:hypothetical protein [bacterium]